MINVRISADRNDFELSVVGHAQYAESGRDIVCASASTISYTLLGFLENCSAVSDLDTVERSGEIEISCVGDKTYVRTAFQMAAIGFLQLEKAYPHHVCVEVSGFRR